MTERAIIKPLPSTGGVYSTREEDKPLIAKLLPSVYFYRHLLSIVFSASRKAKNGVYDDTEWYRSSLSVLRLLERVGVQVRIEGFENLKGTDTPCVFVGNHMSTFETFVLPVIILPFKPVTFVVKQSLVEYPVFKHIMISRDPVVVTRKNPREDLTRVLKEGTERLSRGVSVIIFPQTTRSNDFDPSEFNTIGIKLARRASVPIVPVALKTDAWGCGRIIKDFGKIRPELNAHFAFGEPITVRGRGTEEHKRVIDFISSHLAGWKG